MKLRPILFWTHLSVGVVAGLFLLVLSVTGLLLTYEHTIVDAFAGADTVAVPDGGKVRTADELATLARARSRGAMVIMLNFEKRKGAPVVVHPIGQGDLHEMALDPYTGLEFKASAAGIKSFFETVVGWHRWIGMEGKGRGIGRMVTGAANFLFLILIVTGIYLWWPKVWKWVLLRQKILFRRNPPAGKARDYNWHHVFSFWSLIPLFLIVGSAVIISYPWANALFYRAFGAEAPKQGGPAFIGDLRKDASIPTNGGDATRLASLQDALDAAKGTQTDWNKISLFVHPDAAVPIVRAMVHDGDGVLPEQMTTVTFDRRAARITGIKGYGDLSTVERARMWIRFVHTGEQYGMVGSTIAGLASLASLFLLYTGLALALRRLRDYRVRTERRTAPDQEAASSPC